METRLPGPNLNGQSVNSVNTMTKVPLSTFLYLDFAHNTKLVNGFALVINELIIKYEIITLARFKALGLTC